MATTSTSPTNTLSLYGNTMRMMNLSSSGFDLQSMMDVQLQILQLKQTPYTSKKSALSSEKTTWTDLQTGLKNFQSLSQTLKDFAFSNKKVDFTQSGFATATANSSAIEGSYNLSIQNTAAAQKLLGDSMGDPTAALGFDGTVQIGVKDLVIKSDMSLNAIAIKINGGDYGASATVVSGRLSLTAKSTGLSNKMTFADTAAGSRVTSDNASVAGGNITGALAPGANSYSVTVSQVAKTQKTASAAQTDATSQLGFTGSFVINGQTFTEAATDTLQGIVNKINGNASAGVTASISKDKELILESKNTGAANAFSLADSTTDGTTSLFQKIGMLNAGGAFAHSQQTAQDAQYSVNGVNYTQASNTDQSVAGLDILIKGVGSATVNTQGGNVAVLQSMGILNSTGAAKNEIQAADDARYTLEGIPLTSASNTVSDQITGVTLNLVKATTSAVTVTVSKNSDDYKQKVQDFVNGYNKVIIQINQLTAKAAPLQGKSLPRQLKTALNEALYAATGSKLHTYEIGIELDGTAKDGTIKFNAGKLDEKMKTDPQEVMKLLTDTNGIVSAVNDKLNATAGPAGTIQDTLDGIDKSVTDINNTLQKMDVTYNREKDTLMARYSSLESLLGTIQMQSDYMTSQIASWNNKNGN